MRDRFLFLPEVNEQFGVSVAHLRKIAEAQHGVFRQKRFSDPCMASYPRFTKACGGRWGIFESQLQAYWTRLRNKDRDTINAVERFRDPAKRRRGSGSSDD